MDKRTILYLSYDGMTDPLGQSQVIPYLQKLSKMGYDIHLLSFEKPEKAERKPEIQHLLSHASITWHPLNYTAKPPILSTLYDIRKLFKKVIELHQKYKFSIVHCRSYITALAGQWLKKKYGIKFLFDMRGFFADERVDGGIWKLNNPIFNQIYRFFKKKEKQFFSEADYTVCLTNEGKKIIEGELLVDTKCNPVAVIPCCADSNVFDPSKISESEKTVYRERLNLYKDHRVLAYLGSVGTWYMLPEMLDFFRLMLSKYPKAIFLFITNEQPALILNEARNQGVPSNNIRIISANRQEVPILLSLAHAGIFFIKPVFSKKASSPTKQGEMMSMGLPVICNSGVGDSDYIVKKYHAGIVVEDFCEIAYLNAIEQMEQAPWAPLASIRQGALDYFSLALGVQTYASIYSSLVGEKINSKKEAQQIL